jgi:deoxycytidylate deaminase
VKKNNYAREELVFKSMQEAVNTVKESPHASNKIAACFFGINHDKAPFSITKSNNYPKILEPFVTEKKRFGKNSGYVHAELIAIMAQTGGWEEAFIAITDPPCPNCMKHIASAQIKFVYIDHKGFEKDFFKRRVEDFNLLSKKIAELYGITLFKVYRKEKRIEPLFEALEPMIKQATFVKEVSSEDLKKTFATKESGSVYLEGKTKDGNLLRLMSEPFYYTESEKEEFFPNDKGLSGRFHLRSFPILNVMIEAKRLGVNLEEKKSFFAIKEQISANELIWALKFNLQGFIEKNGEEPSVVVLDKEYMLKLLSQMISST